MKKFRVIKKTYTVSATTEFIIQKYRWGLFKGWHWREYKSFAYGIGVIEYIYADENKAIQMCSLLNKEIPWSVESQITEDYAREKYI